MTTPTFGLTASAAKIVKAMADKHKQQLPAAGQRTRRIGAKKSQ